MKLQRNVPRCGNNSTLFRKSFSHACVFNDDVSHTDVTEPVVEN
jgi:hypothetical protein